MSEYFYNEIYFEFKIYITWKEYVVHCWLKTEKIYEVRNNYLIISLISSLCRVLSYSPLIDKGRLNYFLDLFFFDFEILNQWWISQNQTGQN